MKLLYCRECHDIIALLVTQPRLCACNKSKGFVQQDNITAVVEGPCEVIGFHNKSFANALKHMLPNYGTKFEAFIIPRNARTVTHV